MKDWFVCPCGPARPWDHRSPDNEGVAGSETCVIEISRRLAKRGHDVTVFANCPDDTPEDHGVKWRNYLEFAQNPAPRNEPGNWWLCRHPPLADAFAGNRDDQRLIFRADDLNYGPIGTPTSPYPPDRMRKFDHWLFMSPQQRDFWKRQDKYGIHGWYPDLDLAKTSTLGCGICSERIAAMPKVERDPYRLIWPNCANRGLEHAISILQQARKVEPRLTLHVYYGFEGMDAAAGGNPDHPDAKKKRLIMSMDHTNVVFHGRVNKETLWDAYLRSNIWLYPDSFPECGVVSAQEAQACGAIPVTRPYFGLIEMVKNGVLIEGDPEHPAIQKRYVDSILEIVNSPTWADDFRPRMIDFALRHFDWERVIDHHEVITECASPVMLRTGWDLDVVRKPFARAS